MNTERLDPERAYLLVARLNGVLQRFPRKPEAIGSIVREILELCTGGFYNGKYRGPEEQATWLIHQMQREWDSWQSIHAMIKLFETRFANPRKPSNVYPGLGPKPTLDCARCDDNGNIMEREQYIWCHCEAAARLRAAAPDLLDQLNTVLTRNRRWKNPTSTHRTR